MNNTWTTEDELEAIAYIGNKKSRINPVLSIPTSGERILKLENWLLTSFTRRWDMGINVEKCRNYAQLLLDHLI